MRPPKQPNVPGRLHCPARIVPTGESIKSFFDGQQRELWTLRSPSYPQKREAWEGQMAYTGEISRDHPTCFLFVIDQSGSMEERMGSGRSKAISLPTF
jgi:hypothetical protein